jgi:hypothetical protein
LLVRGGDIGIKGEVIEGRFPAALEVKQLIIHQGGTIFRLSFPPLALH